MKKWNIASQICNRQSCMHMFMLRKSCSGLRAVLRIKHSLMERLLLILASLQRLCTSTWRLKIRNSGHISERWNIKSPICNQHPFIQNVVVDMFMFRSTFSLNGPYIWIFGFQFYVNALRKKNCEENFINLK